MEKHKPRFRPKIFLCIFLTSTVLIPSIPLSYADREIKLQTVADVKEESLVATISDVSNYPQIFSDNVKSVRILDNKTNLIDMNAGVNGFFFDTQAIYQQNPNGTYEVKVVSGNLKGTTMTTELNKTWGFDGKPGMGTKVYIVLDLQTSGFLSWMINFVPDNSLDYALQNGFSKFVDYAQKGQT